MKRLLLCLLFLGCTTAVFPQASNDTPDLGLWKGGSLYMDAYLGPDFINGGINSRTGGVISPRINHSSNLLNTNPASLGSLNHFDINIDSRFGMGTWLADQRFFNNPNDPNINFEAGETNRLYFSARGEFTDQDYGFKSGLYYRYDKRWGLSMVYAQKPNFVLEDPNATSQAYLPVFLKGQNLFADELEVELDELQTNKPNLTTERNISEVLKPAEIRLPSYIGVGVDIPIRNHTVALNYQHYTSEFRVGLGDDAIGKRNAMGAGLAFDFEHTNSFRR